MTCLCISDWTLGTSPSKHLLKHAPWIIWSDVVIAVSHHLMFQLLFNTLPKVCTVRCNYLMSLKSLTWCPFSYLSFILSNVQLMVPTPRLLLSCSVVLFCLTLGYSLLFLGGQRVAAPHAPLSPVPVTLGALGLCFFVLIFKNKSIVCVICFPWFPILFSTLWHQVASIRIYE